MNCMRRNLINFFSDCFSVHVLEFTGLARSLKWGIDHIGDATVMVIMDGSAIPACSGQDMIRAIESACPFGCWGCVAENGRDKIDGRLFRSLRLDSRCIAVSKHWVDESGIAIDEEVSDEFFVNRMCDAALRMNARVITDGRVRVGIKESRGYGLSLIGEIAPHNSVSIILSSYNQKRTIELALEALSRQTELPVEVIISDDGSTDGTIEWIDSLPVGSYPFPLYYVSYGHFGYNVARVYNVGLGRLKGKRLLISNGDVVFSPDSVRLHGLLPDNCLGGGEVRELSLPVSSQIAVQDLMCFDMFERLYEQNRGGYGNGPWMERPASMNPCGFWCGNVSVPVEVYNRVCGFNSGYALKYGGEEPDFVEKCMKHGAQVAWVFGSVGYHLQHPRRVYSDRCLGVKKYREERTIPS